MNESTRAGEPGGPEPIAPLGGVDWSEVAALLRRCDLPVADLETARPEFFAIRDRTGLAGVVGLEWLGEAALLRSLAVRPDRRGSGLGRALANHAEREATRRGVKDLFLLTTTAEAFFAAGGYRRTDRAVAPPSVQATGEFRSLCPASAALMRKRLTSG